jgi:DNA-binding CsgD family transcriptional regulator
MFLKRRVSCPAFFIGNNTLLDLSPCGCILFAGQGDRVSNLNAEQMAELTSVLFAAALDQAKWQDFLTRLSTHAGFVRTHLYGFDFKTNFALEPLHHGYDVDFLQSYTDHYGAINAWAPHLSTGPVGVPLTSDDCLPQDELIKTEYYNDWLLPQGDIRIGAGVVLARDTSRFFVLGGNMTRRDARHEQDWVATLRLLAPHMRQALEIGRNLFDGTANALLGMPTAPGKAGAVMAITQRRQVRYANSAALALAEAGQVLIYDHAGRVLFADPEADAAIDIALSNLRWSRGAASGSVRAQDEKGNVRTIRYARIESDRLGYIPVGVETGSGEPMLLVSIHQDDAIHRLRKTLRERFGLTESEIAIAILIGEGAQAEEIARQRDVSVHTVRDQIKACFRKTGANRQAALVHLLHHLHSGVE